MTKLLLILGLGILLANTNQIGELKVSNPPSKEQANKLNHSRERYEVFLNENGDVVYRDYDYRRIKGIELPFSIMPNPKDKYYFSGKQVNLKIKNGWLVGFNKGEWGGSLFWFNDKGTRYKKITSGNISNIFQINGQVYFTSGLAHLSMSSGKISKVIRKNGKWDVEKKASLPQAPFAITLTGDNEILIVTSKGLLKVNKNFEIETLIEEGIWSRNLYPNSIVINGQDIYIGMRGGILRTQLNRIEKQEWLKK